VPELKGPMESTEASPGPGAALKSPRMNNRSCGGTDCVNDDNWERNSWCKVMTVYVGFMANRNVRLLAADCLETVIKSAILRSYCIANITDIKHYL